MLKILKNVSIFPLIDGPLKSDYSSLLLHSRKARSQDFFEQGSFFGIRALQ